MPTGPPAALGALSSLSRPVARGPWRRTCTWGREAGPASPSSRASRPVTRRSLRGPEGRVRGRPGLIRLRTGHLGGSPARWQLGSQWGRPGARSTGAFILSPSPRPETHRHRGGTATGPHLLAGPLRAGATARAPSALDRPSTAGSGRRVDVTGRASPAPRVRVAAAHEATPPRAQSGEGTQHPRLRADRLGPGARSQSALCPWHPEAVTRLPQGQTAPCSSQSCAGRRGQCLGRKPRRRRAGWAALSRPIG